MSQFWRAMAVGGIGGGGMSLLAFVGILPEDGTGSVGSWQLLVLGVVLLAIGIPSLVKWLKTF